MNDTEFEFQPSQVDLIDPTDVQVNDTAIRVVDPKNEKFIELLADLQRGNPVGNPIHVALATSKETGGTFYELIDGSHRLAAAKAAGHDTIPAFVWPENTPKIVRLGVQLRYNHLRIKQSVAQEGKQFERILATNPDLTVAQLAKLVGYSEAVLNDRLKFTEKSLKPEVLAAVDSGKISAANARTLAKHGLSMQSPDAIHAATILNTDDLEKKLHTEEQALKGSGETATPKPKEEKKYEPKYKPRDRAIIEAEINSGSLAAVKFADPALQEAFLEGVRWAVALDEDTITEAREAFELNLQKAEELKKEKALAKQRAKIAELEKDQVNDESTDGANE